MITRPRWFFTRWGISNVMECVGNCLMPQISCLETRRNVYNLLVMCLESGKESPSFPCRIMQRSFVIYWPFLLSDLLGWVYYTDSSTINNHIGLWHSSRHGMTAKWSGWHYRKCSTSNRNNWSWPITQAASGRILTGHIFYHVRSGGGGNLGNNSDPKMRST